MGLLITVKVFQRWTTVFAEPSPWKGKAPDFADWYDPGLFSRVRWPELLGALVALPVAVYLISFVPLVFMQGSEMSLLDIVPAQIEMWKEQLRVTSGHPYMSSWPEWALMLRPIWYTFDHEGAASDWARGVLLVGNPLVLWTGLIAMFVCAWAWITKRSRQAFLILAFYSILYLSWMVIPRRVSFFYYYYPAALMLSLAFGFVAHHFDRKPLVRSRALRWLRWRWIFAGATLAVFIYFYPILAALRIPADSLHRWMWLDSWI